MACSSSVMLEQTRLDTLDMSSRVRRDLTSQVEFGSNRMHETDVTASYCLNSIVYGCEIWSLSLRDYRKVNIV